MWDRASRLARQDRALASLASIFRLTWLIARGPWHHYVGDASLVLGVLATAWFGLRFAGRGESQSGLGPHHVQ